MKQLTEAQLERVLRRAYTQGWQDHAKFVAELRDTKPSQLTSICEDLDVERDAVIKKFTKDI